MSFEVPRLDNHNYHVFIAHSDDDLETAKSLLFELEKDGLKCILGQRDFVPGELISQNIINAIEQSRRMLLLLSKAFLASEWCTFETIVAMERMYHNNKVTIIPLVIDVEPENIPRLLKHVTYVDMRKEPFYRKKLIKAIIAPDVTVDEMLPAGNVAHGLAWSYYIGYLSLIMPTMKDRIQRSRWWKNNAAQRNMSTKFYILIPKSCYCASSMTDVDPSITYQGDIATIKANVAGNMQRIYKNSVWKIQRPSAEPLYFVGEYATTISTMYEMEAGKIAGLSSEAKRQQVHRFYFTLEQILDHPHCHHCHGKYSLLFYDDTDQEGNTKPISTILVERILTDIQAETNHNDVIRQHGLPPLETPRTSSSPEVSRTGQTLPDWICQTTKMDQEKRT